MCVAAAPARCHVNVTREFSLQNTLRKKFGMTHSTTENISHGAADAPPSFETAAEANATPSPRSLFWTVFPSIMLPMFMAVADQTIVATALPAIASSLGGVERVSWVVVS